MFEMKKKESRSMMKMMKKMMNKKRNVSSKNGLKTNFRLLSKSNKLSFYSR